MSRSTFDDAPAPGTLVLEAAEGILVARCVRMSAHLKAAAQRPEDDPEFVHQLRVSTRQAGAALDLFQDCFTRAAVKDFQAALKTLRRAAGAARDWDVFTESLARQVKALDADERPGADFLFGYALSERRHAQAQLRDAARHAPDDAQWRQRVHELCAAVRARFDRSLRLGDLAVPTMLGLFTELHQVTAASGAPSDEELHATRKLGKRIRYTMLLFAQCFSTPFHEELYPRIQKLQTILGDFNDSCVAIETLQSIRRSARQFLPRKQVRRIKPLLAHLMEHHERRLPRQRQRFRRWLGKWQDLAPQDSLQSWHLTAAD